MTTMVARAKRKARRPLEFTPVPRAPTRADGWTAERQRAFIAGLAATGSVFKATEAVGMSGTHVYKLRTAPGGESFAKAWAAAVKFGAGNVQDVLFDQTINGEPQEVWYLGKPVGHKRVFRHQSMKFILQHHMPEDYGGKVPFGRDKRADGHCCDAARAAAEQSQRVRTSLTDLATELGFGL